MKKRSLAILFMVVFIDLLGFGIVLPLLPFYASEYGASGTTVGVIVGIYSLMQFFFAPIWGRLSDRYGRRPIIMLSLSGSVLGYAIFAVAESVLVLLVARVVAGIAAANISTAQAYVSDVTDARDRAKGMGIIGAAFGIGFIFGPIIGGLLSSFGSRMGIPGNMFPGIAASLFSLLALVTAIFFLGESRPEGLRPRTGRPPQFDPATWSRMIGDRSLSRVFVALFLVILAFASMETSVVLHGEAAYDLRPKDLGFFFGLMGMIVAVIQGGLIGRLSNRFGERALVRGGTILLSIGFVIVPFIQQEGWLFVAAILIATGQGVSYPSLTSLVSQLADPKERGSTLGVSSSLSSLARVAGPVLAGFLYDLLSAWGPFISAAMMTLIASGLMIAALRGRVGEVGAIETKRREPSAIETG